METTIVAGLKTGLKALVARTWVASLVGMTFFVQPAWSAISISPSPSTNGAFSVSWSSPLGCSSFYDDFGIPWETCYLLTESGPTSGTWWSGSSLNFSGKPSGNYTYTVLVHYTSYYWGIDQWYTAEGPASVSVCTTYTVPYYSGWAFGNYRSPYSGACSFYYSGLEQYPSEWDGVKWCDAGPVPQSGTVNICN
jgi:hypothetical protein